VYFAVTDSLSAEVVEPLLRGRFGNPYEHVVSTPSTQLLLPPTAPEGALVTADEQTAGRGRLSRRWLAPAGTSLLCSLQLRPAVESLLYDADRRKRMGDAAQKLGKPDAAAAVAQVVSELAAK